MKQKQLKFGFFLPLAQRKVADIPLQSNVQSTQEIVELILDSNRNALLALDLQVISVVLQGPSRLIFGRSGLDHDTWHWYWRSSCRCFWNECGSTHLDDQHLLNSTFQLVSQLEQNPYAFYVFSTFATSLAFIVAWTGLRK